jgi:hypothetical protein
LRIVIGSFHSFSRIYLAQHGSLSIDVEVPSGSARGHAMQPCLDYGDPVLSLRCETAGSQQNDLKAAMRI